MKKTRIAALLACVAVVIVSAAGLGSSFWHGQELSPGSSLISASVTGSALTTQSATTQSVERAVGLHESLWKTVAERARTDRYYLYAIYASRVLVVKNPEIYLQSDAMFLREITSKNGYQRAYQIKDVTDDYFITQQALSGPPFSFRDVDFKAYKTVVYRQLYPEEYPFLTYLDRRMLPVASTLKLTDPRISQLELAVQYYFSLKESDTRSQQVYIVYCDNENSYTYSNGVLTSMADLSRVDEPDGKVILIFNEEHVWYPLMERDDSKNSPALSQLVKEFSKGVQIPDLSEFENETLSTLRAATELNSEDQIIMAELAATHSEGVRMGQVVYTELKACWEKLGLPFNAGDGHFRTIYRLANYLSPITARLAAIADDLEGRARVKAISVEYTAHTATYFYEAANISWGHSWPCELTGSTVDDTYRTRGSHCVWQATNLASVMDVIGVENYILELGSNRETNRHTTVYLPEYDLVLGNGVIESDVYGHRNTILSYVSPEEPRTVVYYISHGEKWASPIVAGVDVESRQRTYYGTISPDEASDLLEQLRSIHNDSIEGLAFQQGKHSVITFSQLIEGLQEQQNIFEPPELP